MSEPPGDRVRSLFDQAVSLPSQQRAAFLEAACSGDANLRAFVESLLEYDLAFPEEEGMLKSPLVRDLPKDDGQRTKDESRGSSLDSSFIRHPSSFQRVGRYRIVRLIAEGGMGAVYEAEQDSPRRTVALKVVKPGLASDTLLKRFSYEAQILARLHHPGIAQVYEADIDEGRPFFAMEFIRGVPLDEHARIQALTLRARLALLARVCDAVQHAHDQGVIHRDLKPANILVEETGQPKVLDFGVARITGADLLTEAGLTQTGQLLGTPSYSSPEQVTADPAAIDHRTDVYALGVILFELLAHRLPHQLDNRSLAEAVRLILEQDPPRLGSIDPELRGDIETIVAKSLEKDPARRYQSASDLAADLRRWLAHEPILARPPSALYHLSRFARPHKTLVGGLLATGLALVLGLVGTIIFAVGEAHQRGQAEHNAREANDEKIEARFQTYRARIAAAVAALSTHDVADAARQLDSAPKDLRDWEWQHLHSRLDDSSSVIPLPDKGVGFLLTSPDQLRVGTWTRFGLRLEDVSGGKPRTLLDREGWREVTVTYTRRGLRVAAWVGNTTFELLDEAGQVLCRVKSSEVKRPSPIVVSPDGARLAFAWREGEWKRLGVFDSTSGKRTAVCAGHRDGTWSITFSPDGTQLASGGEDGTVCVWDPATGKLLASCVGHVSKVLSIAFRPDGARLVTASSDGTVRQWDASTGREAGAPYDRHSAEVAAAVYSPDGQWVASGGADRTVRVWRAKGRQDVAVLHGHTGGVTGLAFSPRPAGGPTLASSSNVSGFLRGDGTVRVWDVDPKATLPVLRGHTSYVYPVAFSPDGLWISSGGWDNTLRSWDAATGEPCSSTTYPGVVWSLAYGPDGSWLVAGNNRDNRLRIQEVATARIRKEIRGPTGRCHSVIVSPDGKKVAATAFVPPKKHHLAVYLVESGEQLFSAEGWALAYSPDGRWLAVLAEDKKTVLLLDARTHETAARFSGHEEPVLAAAFSPDNRRLASGSQDRTVRLWQVDSGSCQVLVGHTDQVYAVAFHPDGKRLATAGQDRAVWLWDLERGEEVARLPGHTGYVWSLAFSPDGSTLASGSGDFTVRLWDTAPVKKRYQARREAEALRPEAERLIEPLWQMKKDPAEVVEAVRAKRELSEPLRRAALRAVLRRAQAAEVPGKPPDPP